MQSLNQAPNTNHRNPHIKIIKWQRFPEKIDFTRPNRFVIAGMPESGKSALVETLAAKQDDYGEGKVIDIFCSRDNEGLSWLRHQNYKNNVLLLHGDTTRVSSEYETRKISQLKWSDFEKNKTIISAPSFYSTLREEWNSIDKITRTIWKRTSWKKVWFIAVREGTSLLYSRLGLGENQAQAKASFIYAIKEFRHCGCALDIDIIRYYGLDTEVRTISNYTFIKAHGIEGLSHDLHWLYRYYDLFRDIMQMPPWAFIIISRKGGVGHGTFEYPYWHKEERENILDLLNIQVEYGGAINYGDKGNRRMSDFEHVSVIKARLSGVAMNKLAEGGKWKYQDEDVQLEKRSPRTINLAIMSHNKDVATQGHCQICKRVQAETVQSSPA